MRDEDSKTCLMNIKEFQVTVFLMIIAFILYRVYPNINVIRLTPLYSIRPFFLTLEPGSTIGMLGACIAGPLAGLILGLVAWNPIYVPEVFIITKVTQFLLIGYLHRKIQSPWNITGIPLGMILSTPLHPTIVHYIMFKQVIIHLYWGANIVFQTVVNFIFYILIRLLVPRLFSWVHPNLDFKINIPYLLNHSE